MCQGTETVSHLGLKIWDIKTDENRSINNPETLKIKIKKSN